MISIIDQNNRDYDFCHNRTALLPGITFSLDFLVVADHFVICVYISRRELMFHRASMPWPQQKKGLGDKKTPDEKAVKGTNKTRQSFISLLTSSLVYQCVSEK